MSSVAYRPFVEAATQAATTQPLPGRSAPLSGTPTVVIDGQLFRGDPADPAAFEAAIDAARG
ncbi:DsbA family protein [Burkholderia cenocepacia]|uniref:hypothetical protein n=1 Tax=Burkholderia cenocepacia TaxID=95486 RepID=UPI0038CBF9A7